MGRDAAKAAKNNSNIGANNATTLNTRATDVFNGLFPQLQDQAQNGLSPSDEAAMNTASQQSVGGGTAAAVGSANLAAARTRNAGGYQPAVSEAARAGERINSANALATKGKSIDMKQKALQALEGLYGANVEGGNQALNTSNQAVGQWTNADQQTMANTGMWLDFINKIGSGAMPDSPK
jgi:hypothetical protein